MPSVVEMNKQSMLLLLLLPTMALVGQLCVAIFYLSGFTFHRLPFDTDRSTNGTDTNSRAAVRQFPVSPTSTPIPDTLLQSYEKRYTAMRVKHDNLANVTRQCPAAFQDRTPACWIPDCNVSFPPLQERLQHVLQTQRPLTGHQRGVLYKLTSRVQYFDIVFITAASSDHFEESQGVIKSLHEVVFPELLRQGLWTFHLYYYDLGLDRQQRTKLKRHCNCTVLPFPFSSLPGQFRRLRTCIWKPLLMKAHLNSSRFTLWMDASTRFTDRNITPILHQSNQFGIFLSRNNYMTLMHIHPAMMSYFNIKPCVLAPFYEIAGGFVALHNDVFAHKAILDSWVACAFSPKCLCPMIGTNNCESFLKCKNRKHAYFRCHRYDQSALAIILILLFDWRATYESYTC